MSDPHPPAPASGGGGGGKKGVDLGKAWGIAILLIVLLMVNVIGMLAGQINDLLQVVKMNVGTLLILAGLAAIFKAIGKKS